MKASLLAAALMVPLLSGCDPAHTVRLYVKPSHPSSTVPTVISGVAEQLEMQQSEGVNSQGVHGSFNYVRRYEPSKAVTLSAAPADNQAEWRIEIFEMPAFRQSWFSKDVQSSVEEALRNSGYSVVPIK